MSAAPGITIENLSVVFKTGNGRVTALADVSFDIAPRSFLSVVGPSGCGKSTLLKILSGVLQPSKGRILFDGRPVDKSKIQGQVGYVFQRALLLPWRTALQNVILTMEVARRDMSKAEREQEARRWLEITGLKGFEHRYPHELSGGMQQRVSICRALAFRPKILLMDEPFAALDEITRFALNDDLLQLWETRRPTVLFVTHSVFESVYLSTRIAVMSARPGHMVADLSVGLPHPRAGTRTTPAYGAICETVSRALGLAMTDART